MMSDVLDSRIQEIFDNAEAGREDYLEARRLVYSDLKESEKLKEIVEVLSEQLEHTRDEQKRKDICIKAGIGLWIQGKTERAAELLAEVKAFKNASYFLGKCLAELGNREEALAQFEKVANLESDAFDLQMELADSKRSMEQVGDAMKIIQKMSRKHDDEPELHYQQGRCLESLGEYEGAMDEYERALELDGEHSKTIFRLALISDLRGKDEQVISYYERCCSLSPTYVNALVNLGTVYEDNGEYEKAIDCYDTVLSVDPKHPRAKLFMKDAVSSLDMYYDEDFEKRADKNSQVLEIPVTDFELSVRSRNCLEKMNIRTLGQLTRISEAKLLGYKNFGETSLGEIKDILSQKGLRLGQFLEEDEEGGGFDVLELEDVDEETEEKDESPISELGLSIYSQKCLERLGINTIDDLITQTEAGLAPKLRPKWLKEIKSRLAEKGLALGATGCSGEI